MDSDKILTNGGPSNSRDNLPTDDQIPGQPSAIPALSLTLGPSRYTTITHSECIAHLKFLGALSDLRDTITSIQNLFNIPDPTPQEFGSHINEAWALVKEKRWAVYTAKAVERYATWWNNCVPSSRLPPTTSLFYSSAYDSILTPNTPLVWTRDELPPLDVLMVWHAHMLNPRSFLEDCIRQGKISFWSAGFPWEVINASIDDQTLTYDPGETAIRAFPSKTKLDWDNLQGLPTRRLQCPNCSYENTAPWTNGKLKLPFNKAFDDWRGYTDKHFRIDCGQCQLGITHESLRVQKFRQDVEELLERRIPMPGTFYNLGGVPQQLDKHHRRRQSADFPNRLIKAAKRDIREYMRSTLWVCPSVTMLRDYLGALLRDRGVMIKANPNSNSSLCREEKVAFRRMMSRYWDNSSQFALDLVGAVVRQGTFIQKMDNIDWLHSPTVTETMHRLIRKYAIFFQIMSSNPGRMAVPTLDVDLAWHTHQLSPRRYFKYSTHRTEQDGKRAIFIDHDDKVSEIKLSDAFEWTTKAYRKITDGGIYSECTCWYCEATRASDLQSRLLFPSSSAAKARVAAANLHDNPAISSNPDKNPHISAHSAVKLKDAGTSANPNNNPCYLKFFKLRSEYEKSRRRAEKRNKTTAGKGKQRSKDDDNNDTDVCTATYPLMWGYPVYVPYYGPYTCDPSVHGDVYAADPSCMSLQPGLPGNCASGTCGGDVTAGTCGGIAPGCSGGCTGGFGFGFGGHCGGSSGSACGGGGGGCGGGGSGGGGGG